MTFEQLKSELKAWLEERGWHYFNDSEYSPGRWEVRIYPIPEDEPPPLGVHVVDGIGAKDKIMGR